MAQGEWSGEGVVDGEEDDQSAGPASSDWRHLSRSEGRDHKITYG